MNRIESTVADPDDGRVTHDETSLAVDAVRGRPRGERVLVLVRPEIVEVEAAGSAPNGLVGEVVSQTFLGSVTRLRVLAGPTEWTADLSAARAAALPIGARVSLRFPSAGAKVLSLEGATPPEPSDG
jgi:putative spermidine/putrescine transport system ATP-binding protein